MQTHSPYMILNNVRMLLQVVFELIMLALISLAEMDSMIRVIAGVLGIIVAVLTAIRIIQKIIIWRSEHRLKQLEVKEKEESVRRYFETNYDTTRSSKEISEPVGAARKQVQG